MCGICGVWEYGAATGRVEGATVERMRDEMAHRGPDDAGAELLDEGRLGLGFRRLSIIDLSRHPVERSRCLGPRLRIWAATVPRFCGIFAHCHRRREGFGLYRAGKLCSSISLHQSLGFLDTMAHVAVVLDSRLCISSARDFAARNVVAQPGAGDLHGGVWAVAPRQRAISSVGGLSRRAFGA